MDVILWKEKNVESITWHLVFTHKQKGTFLNVNFRVGFFLILVLTCYEINVYPLTI